MGRPIISIASQGSIKIRTEKLPIDRKQEVVDDLATAVSVEMGHEPGCNE